MGKLITETDVGEMLQGAGAVSPQQSPSPSPHGSPVTSRRRPRTDLDSRAGGTQGTPQSGPSTRQRNAARDQAGPSNRQGSATQDLPEELQSLRLTGSPAGGIPGQAPRTTRLSSRTGLRALSLTGRFAINVGGQSWV